MKITVIAGELAQKEFQHKAIPHGVHVYFVTTPEEGDLGSDAYFYLEDEERLAGNVLKLERVRKPVFVNAIVSTLKDLPANCIRINAWPGFLANATIELTAAGENLEMADKILQLLAWEYSTVPDIAGMITPRIIAMIINEAYFALAEGVSSRDEIDIAMKLGTNYPYGPFEWCQRIGAAKIAGLLSHLSQADERYIPAPLLQQEVKH